MNNPRFVPELNFSADGFIAPPNLIAVAASLAAKIHRHAQPPVDSVQVRVTKQTPRSASPCFIVSITAFRPGANRVAHASARDPLPAIEAAFHKMERSVIELHAMMPIA